MQKIYIGFNMFYEVYKNGKRTIYAPSKDLKNVQRQILNFINTKYKLKFNIKETAEIHCNQKWILKLDIRKFYESVSKEQIKSVIDDIYETVSFPKEYYSKKILYQLLTIEDKLPTGAVTSCLIANLAFSKTKIDENLKAFCLQNNLKYSRYMDDMFLSGNNKADLKKAEKFAIKLLQEAGFNLNYEKTQYISNNKRQEILGLVVNNPMDCVISNDKKRSYRSMFFNYLKAVYLEERLGINSLFKKKIGFKEITGHLAYIKSTDKKFYTIIKKFLKLKINKFGIYNNDEIKKLRKIIK